MADLTISEMSARFSLTLRTLRFWQQKGLISPKMDGKTSRTMRRYSDRDQRRVDLILTYQRLGLSLEEIRAKLDLDDTRAHLTGAERRRLRRALAVQRAQADENLQLLREIS